MPQERPASTLGARVGWLAAFLASSDLVRVRIEHPTETIEVGRQRRAEPRVGADATAEGGESGAAPDRLERITADLVGVFRLGRPAAAEGDLLEGDREIGFIESLGIRNPVHSLGGGRIVTIAVADGAVVEYGQPLFLLDRT